MKTLRMGMLLAGLVLLTMPVLASAQEAAESATRTVTVAGSGSVEAKPDTALINLGVTIQQATVPDALAEANKTMTAIIRAVKAQGIAQDDIQTSNFSVYTVRDYSVDTSNGSPAPVVGYSVSNQVTVTIHDVSWKSGMPSDVVGNVINAAIDAGATDINGVSFQLSDSTAAEQQARTLAIQNASQRATELAAAVGKQLGDVVAVSEGVSYTPLGSANGNGGGAGAGNAAGNTPILGGTVEIVISVTVTYELV